VWPAIVLRTPKGWTGPKVVDGEPVEGTFRAHQVPLATVRENPAHLRMLEEWMHSYRPEELFDESGRFRRVRVTRAARRARMGANPHANGGVLSSPSISPLMRTTRSPCRHRRRAAGIDPRPRLLPARHLQEEPGLVPPVLPDETTRTASVRSSR
jgi:phosphoketolase